MAVPTSLPARAVVIGDGSAARVRGRRVAVRDTLRRRDNHGRLRSRALLRVEGETSIEVVDDTEVVLAGVPYTVSIQIDRRRTVTLTPHPGFTAVVPWPGG